MDESKPWRCTNNHVLGLVMRDSGGVRRLLLFREAIPTNPGNWIKNGKLPDAEIDVMAVVEGYVADVRCSICEKVRTWVPGEEAIRRLLERRGVTLKEA